MRIRERWVWALCCVFVVGLAWWVLRQPGPDAAAQALAITPATVGAERPAALALVPPVAAVAPSASTAVAVP